MREFDTLYARNSNGKINTWTVSVDTNGKVIILEGIVGGTVTNSERQSKGKNIGKMNETSPFEQACLEAESRWNLKKKKGYKTLKDLEITFDGDGISHCPDGSFYSSINDSVEWTLPKNRTDANNLSKPMLALPMFDSKTGKSRAIFPMIGQPKLNGFRMMCRWEKVMEGEGIFRQEVEKPVFRSRDGIRFTTLDHIEANLTKDMFFHEGEELAFDGEIYYNDWLLQRINSAVNKTNSDTINLKFFVFDIAIENMIQTRRLELLRKILSRFDFISNPNILEVQSEKVDNIEDAQKKTDWWIRWKYEGGIFRDPKGFYQFGKRNSTMLKLKRFQDAEFVIADIIGGDNAPDMAVFICVAENGERFKVNPEGTHEVKKEYLINKTNYIGKKLTVKFYERTERGIPFHAIGLTIREVM